MHVVAVVAIHGAIPLEVALPCAVFDQVRTSGPEPAYRVLVCGEAKEIKGGAFDLRTQWDLSHLEGADTVIVPGIQNPTMPITDPVLEALRSAVDRGARVASICTGAFVLAAAGLLDGRRATTHWRAASELAARYPAIEVDPNVLYVDNGQVLTSAGVAAGFDLCLHLVRRDYGAAVAASAARDVIMPLEREGGQAQFILHEPPASRTTLAPLLTWMERNLHRALSLDEIAQQARMSTRTLSRRFKQQTGISPLQWILNARVRRARSLLETTDCTVEQVAAQVGFETAATLREHFAKAIGVGPAAYRRSFGQGRSTHAVTLQ